MSDRNSQVLLVENKLVKSFWKTKHQVHVALIYTSVHPEKLCTQNQGNLEKDVPNSTTCNSNNVGNYSNVHQYQNRYTNCGIFL